MQSNDHNQGWLGFLSFSFVRQDMRTVVKDKRHIGPLVLQRPYYQETTRPSVLVIHPPGGVVGGDTLTVNVRCFPDSEGLVSTPAATKFYRSERRLAKQAQTVVLTENVALEWLPQETLFFNASRVKNSLKFELEKTNNKLIAWDIVGLGRPASGEGFDAGELFQSLEVWIEGRLVFVDRLQVLPQTTFLKSASGLAGYDLLATALFYQENEVTQKALFEVLQSQEWSAFVGVTMLDKLIVMRVLANELDDVKSILYEAWVLARPYVIGVPAIKPRIWNT